MTVKLHQLAQDHTVFTFRDYTFPADPSAQQLPRTPRDLIEAKLAAANHGHLEIKADIDRRSKE